MITLTYIIGAVVLLGLCIFVHELGHLLGGKMVGIKARVFSMGYGKGFWKKKIGDTTYQITLIPFGGYCQFYGEDPSEARSGEGFEFLSAHPFKRIVTVAMGPVFNLIFGILLFFIMNIAGYEKETNRILIPKEFVSGTYTSAAYSVGMRSGDRIVSMDGAEIKAFSDIQSAVFFSDGREIRIEAESGGELKKFNVKPTFDSVNGRYSIGVMPYTKGVALSRVIAGSPAEKAGITGNALVTKIDGMPVRTPSELSSLLQKGDGKESVITFQAGEMEKSVSVRPEMTDVYIITPQDESKSAAGITGNGEFRRMILDGIVKVDGKPITDYSIFRSDVLRGINSGRELIIDVDKERFTGRVSLDSRYMIGIEQKGVVFEMIPVQYGVAGGLVQAFVEPWDFLVMNIKGFGMLFSGKINVRENLSGPIRIGKLAGDVLVERGISDFILLMAKISVILMFMNLLPIPAVDGSHLLFYLIEAIRGKPINEQIMIRIQTFGVVFLIVLGIFVIINDITMLPFVKNLFR